MGTTGPPSHSASSMLGTRVERTRRWLGYVIFSKDQVMANREVPPVARPLDPLTQLFRQGTVRSVILGQVIHDRLSIQFGKVVGA